MTDKEYYELIQPYEDADEAIADTSGSAEPLYL